MKSMNFICSFGALTFLLLVVGSAHGQGTAVSGDDCIYEDPVLAKTCKPLVGLACRKNDGTFVEVVGGEGKCGCRLDYAWDATKVQCLAKLDDDGSKLHGKSCRGPKACKEPTVCHYKGKPGEGKPDTEGTLWKTDDAKGKCVCTGGKTFMDNTCKGSGDTKKKHGEEGCTANAGSKCEDGLTCRVGGTVGEADKADQLGTEEATGSKKGRCVCPGGNKRFEGGKCKEVTGGTTDPGSGKPKGSSESPGGGSGSRSDRNVYQPISLQLIFSIATGIGSLLLF